MLWARPWGRGLGRGGECPAVEERGLRKLTVSPQRWPLSPCCGLSPGALLGSCVSYWARERWPCSCDANHQAPDSLLGSIWTSAFEICFESVRDIGLFWLGKFYQGFSIGTGQAVPMPNIKGKAAWGPCFRDQISRMFNLIRMVLWLLPRSLNPRQVNTDDICSSWRYLKWVWKGHWLTSKLPPCSKLLFLLLILLDSLSC